MCQREICSFNRYLTEALCWVNTWLPQWTSWTQWWVRKKLMEATLDRMARKDLCKVSFEQKGDNEMAISSMWRTDKQKEKQRFWGYKGFCRFKKQKESLCDLWRKYGEKDLDVGRSQMMKGSVFKKQWKVTWPDVSFLKDPSGYYISNLGRSKVKVGRPVTEPLQYIEWQMTAV